MSKKEDLRIIKTKRSIYDAFVELMNEKTFEEIKVSEICEKALINRSTFYAHFEDKYDLLDKLIIDLKNDFKREIEMDKTFSNIEEFYHKTMEVVFNHIFKNKDIYLKLINKNRNSIAMDMIYDSLEESIKGDIEKYYKGNVPTDIISHYCIGGIFNVVLMFLKNPKYTKEELIDYLNKLILK